MQTSRVADGSFLGLLEEALGEDAGLQFRKDLRLGAASLVLDALDEVHVTSGETAFVAFLTGLCRYLRTSVADGNIVLLARAETSAWVKYVFEQENVGLHEYELSYFTRPQSDEYLDLKLDSLYERQHSPAVHRTHRQPFERAKNELLQRLACALGHQTIEEAWGTADGLRLLGSDGLRLLGYSPVLEGIAAFLAVSDHRVLDVSATDVGSAQQEWGLLASLNEQLLERERAKFLNNWLDVPKRAMFETEDAVASTRRRAVRPSSRSYIAEPATTRPPQPHSRSATRIVRGGGGQPAPEPPLPELVQVVRQPRVCGLRNSHNGSR